MAKRLSVINFKGGVVKENQFRESQLIWKHLNDLTVKEWKDLWLTKLSQRLSF